MMLVSLWLCRSVALKAKLDITCCVEGGGCAINTGCNKRELFWAFRLLKSDPAAGQQCRRRLNAKAVAYSVQRKTQVYEWILEVLSVMETTKRPSYYPNAQNGLLSTWHKCALGNAVRNRFWSSKFSLFKTTAPATSLIRGPCDPVYNSYAATR